MGILRLLCALSIVIHHTHPIFGYTLLGREPALRTFYVISGFYMSLVLNEKYRGQKNSYWLFITNRVLRIYPIYWFILILSVSASLFVFHEKTVYSLMDLIRNATLLIRTDYLVINTDYREPLILPQALTLVLECTFYLIAPFIVRRKVVEILALCIISVFIRFVTFVILRLHHEPTGDWFFPGMMVFFLFGVLSYKLYTGIQKIKFSPKFLSGFALLFFTVTLLYYQIPLDLRFRWIDFKLWIYLGFVTISIPFLFHLTAREKINQFLGDLSYPMYLSHILIANIAASLFAHLLGNQLVITVIFYTTIASIVLSLFLEKPIDSLRQKRIRHKRTL